MIRRLIEVIGNPAAIWFAAVNLDIHPMLINDNVFLKVGDLQVK